MRLGCIAFLALALTVAFAAQPDAAQPDAAEPRTAAEPRWTVRFFHDLDDSEFHINDLKFPSPRRGIACGFLEEKGRIKPRVLVTSDGGDTWSFVKTRRVDSLCSSSMTAWAGW